MLFCKDSRTLSNDNLSATIHAVITDPPYGLNLMGQSWDKVLPPKEVWQACFHVLKPGGFCLAFGHTRLYHRVACDLEDAGFDIIDCLCWGYATGAPRPYNIDKAIDKYAGIEITPEFPYEPKSYDAQQWQGWANILKVSWEPIIMARKPVEGNLVNNVLKYKVGVLNIDECRIPYASEEDRKSLESFAKFEGQDHGDSRFFSANTGGKKQCNVHPMGRWPGNMLWLDPLFAEYDHIFMVPKPSIDEKGAENEHTTVKPLRLMERLIKMVTPRPSVVKEDIYVLDPFMGCYDEQTEVLTRVGWKKFDDVTKDDYFASHYEGKVVYHRSTKLHKYYYDGKMKHFCSRSTDLLVTPNHNMYVLTHADFCANREPRFLEAQEMKQNLYRIPCGGTFEPVNEFAFDVSFGEHKIQDSMYLIGLYLSEGYLSGNRLIVCQNPGNKMSRMFERLSRSFTVKIVSDRKFKIILSDNDLSFVLENCGQGSKTKYISDWLLQCRNIRDMFDGMIIGDGHTHKQHGQTSYYTSSQQLANTFQILCLHLGFDSTLGNKGMRSSNIDGREVNSTTDGLVVTIRRSKNKKILQSHIHDVNYSGYVYCVTVPQHTLYVRRNGRTTWCGNSGTTGVACKVLGRKFIGYELDPESFKIAEKRINQKKRRIDIFDR